MRWTNRSRANKVIARDRHCLGKNNHWIESMLNKNSTGSITELTTRARAVELLLQAETFCFRQERDLGTCNIWKHYINSAHQGLRSGYRNIWTWPLVCFLFIRKHFQILIPATLFGLVTGFSKKNLWKRNSKKLVRFCRIFILTPVWLLVDAIRDTIHLAEAGSQWGDLFLLTMESKNLA